VAPFFGHGVDALILGTVNKWVIYLGKTSSTLWFISQALCDTDLYAELWRRWRYKVDVMAQSSLPFPFLPWSGSPPQAVRGSGSAVNSPTVWQAELTFIRNCWYQQFELLISAIRIVDINNSNCWCQQFGVIVDISNSYCWYQQFKLLISTILIAASDNCWYQQFELLISTIANKC